MWADIQLDQQRENEQYWGVGNPTWTKQQIKECVTFVRLELYNRDLPCGPKAIQPRLEEYHIRPVPSMRTIARILARHGLTYRRTGFYNRL
jgi:hypothetical protein